MTTEVFLSVLMGKEFLEMILLYSQFEDRQKKDDSRT